MGSVPCLALLLLFSVATGEKRTKRSSDGFSYAERETIVHAHNEFRHSVDPPATNMKEMSWSDELEGIAQNYAEQCNFNHNDARSSSSTTYPYVGENIYVHSNERDARAAVQSWFDERKGYHYYSNSCSAMPCLHYTQVVWANSNKVGCGVAWCDYIQNLYFWNPPSGYIIICNYGPGGNYNGEKPYEIA